MVPENINAEKKDFFKKFFMITCLPNDDEKWQLKKVVVETYDVFARKCFDGDDNTELKNKLSPEYPLPVYLRGPQGPNHLLDELLIEIASLECFNFITTLSYSKKSSPMLFHKKTSGILRILFDFRRVNHLCHQYLNSNFQFSNMTDATNDIAGKVCFVN